MLPPRSCIAAITYLRPNHTPRTFTAITRSKLSTSQSTIAATPPSIPAFCLRRIADIGGLQGAFVEVDHQHLRSCVREQPRRCQADTAAGAGDNCHFVVESIHRGPKVTIPRMSWTQPHDVSRGAVQM